MIFYHKFYLSGTNKKKDVYAVLSSIDYMTYTKNPADATEGTTLHCNNMNGKLSYVVDGVPDMVNNGIFNGIFFKCTAWRAVEGWAGEKGDAGGMKKYTVWINPNNVSSISMDQPDSTIIYLKGTILAIPKRIAEFMSELINHNKQYKERTDRLHGKTQS